jgi:hypothetical protein
MANQASLLNISLVYRPVAIERRSRFLSSPFTPAEAYKRHVAERRWLTDRLAEEHDGPTVVVTHHAPHPGSLHERYDGDGANPLTHFRNVDAGNSAPSEILMNL